ncbi:MAG TPA: STAS domain-containing protein [Candidatus Saccharimonadales bacterium]|jgi:anti-anti-sigma factor
MHFEQPRPSNLQDFVTGFSEGISTISVPEGSEMDLSNAGLLRQVLLSELEKPECKTLVFDMAGVTFVDSTTYGVLLTALRRSHEESKELLLDLRGVSDEKTKVVVKRGFEMNGLDKVFKFMVDLEE